MFSHTQTSGHAIARIYQAKLDDHLLLESLKFVPKCFIGRGVGSVIR